MNGKLEFWHHHGGVSVPNLDAAIAWYRDVLGFEFQYKATIPGVPCTFAIVQNGDLRMEIFEVPGAKPLPSERRVPDEDLRTHGNKHVSFAVDDVPAFGEELRKRGADIVWIKEFPNGKANIFIRDLAGNLIEFVKADRPQGLTSRLPAAK
jgi:methylmalonyl-CoA/ethylmalonyl-CoA epimerase